MQLRQSHLPSDYEPKLRAALAKRGFSLDDGKRLADCVMQLSNFYLENPSAPTPWHEQWAQVASLVYFFPLNYARCSLVARELRRFGFFDGLSTFIDDGAGMGSALHAFNDVLAAPGAAGSGTAGAAHVGAADSAAADVGAAPGKSGGVRWLARDISGDALRILNELALNEPFATEVVAGSLREPAKRDLLVASYVFTELKEIPRDWLSSEALVILEPSTRDDARRLQAERPKLLAAGFHLWAPCPHHEDCPLLVTERDWCHDRVHFEAPAWFAAVEKHLPIKNRTLTFTYLAARKTPPPARRYARLVGDTLDEKGKSRQALCRSAEREFLAWFPQRFAKKTHIEMSRGSLVELAPDLEKKSLEVRLREPSDVRELATDEVVR